MASTLFLSSLKYPFRSRHVLRTPSQVTKCLIPAFSHEDHRYARNLQDKSTVSPSSHMGLSFKRRSQKPLRAKKFYTCASVETQGVELEVAVSIEGSPLGGQSSVVEDLASALSEDAVSALKEALKLEKTTTNASGQRVSKEIVELSIVLCDDPHITELNRKWRSIASPTDVLSFPLDDGEDDQDIPIQMLGDVVISIDTADRQAQERQTELLTECRILLLHGLLHLLGFDHDQSPKDWKEMTKTEEIILDRLGWDGKGLIGATEDGALHVGVAQPNPERLPKGAPVVSWRSKTDIKVVALDLDGTLLSSKSEILQSSREAILAAIGKGVKVMLSTGKTRPAALSACGRAGLAGDGLVISKKSPGVFLQGLAVHDWSGNAIMGPDLTFDFVDSVFQYCDKNSISCIAFLGDECATMTMTDEIVEMHEVYYEPLAQVRTLPQILNGPSVKKLVVIADPGYINEEIQPYWAKEVIGAGANVMNAVDKHLELVPDGANKWNGLKKLIGMAGISMEAVMSVGDGGNDVLMVEGTGIGVAVGNASEKVKEVADVIVASNDDGGVAEAFERFVL